MLIDGISGEEDVGGRCIGERVEFREGNDMEKVTECQGCLRGSV